LHLSGSCHRKDDRWKLSWSVVRETQRAHYCSCSIEGIDLLTFERNRIIRLFLWTANAASLDKFSVELGSLMVVHWYVSGRLYFGNYARLVHVCELRLRLFVLINTAQDSSPHLSFCDIYPPDQPEHGTHASCLWQRESGDRDHTVYTTSIALQHYYWSLGPDRACPRRKKKVDVHLNIISVCVTKITETLTSNRLFGRLPATRLLN
jgi:hypothetical protein